MKKAVRYLCAVMLMLSCFTLSACSGSDTGKPDPKYAGTWNAVKAEFGGEEQDINEMLSDGFTIVLNEDGTAFISQDGDENNAKWGVKNSEIKIKGDKTDMTLKIDADTLSMSLLGVKFTFEKE